MNETANKKEFTAFEYKEVTVAPDQASMFLDCYENFGWHPDENPYPREKLPVVHSQQSATLRLKRDRKIINKVELTRLQRHFEACINEIKELEKAKTRAATAWSLAVGIVGTAFMAGSTFAIVLETPIVWLCVVLAVPGFLGWILPLFVYQKIRRKKTEEMDALIEAKYDEIYEICEKGHSLL